MIPRWPDELTCQLPDKAQTGRLQLSIRPPHLYSYMLLAPFRLVIELSKGNKAASEAEDTMSQLSVGGSRVVMVGLFVFVCIWEWFSVQQDSVAALFLHSRKPLQILGLVQG